jgi:hypothetical protein
LIRAPKCRMISTRGHSKNTTGNRCKTNHDRGTLHCTETQCSRYSARGQKVWPVTFYELLFPDVKRANLNHCRQMPRLTFWVYMDDSMDHNRPRTVSKFEKHHLLRLPRPLYWPRISPCDPWLLSMVKGIPYSLTPPRQCPRSAS